MADSLTVLVLGGGPDRERPVSLKSAAAVAAALREAGHTVIESDIGPGNESPLDGRFDVVFPVLHGRFGEGGPLQRMMDARGLRYVGCKARAAATAMDKCASKQMAERHGVPTPPYQLVGPRKAVELDLPVVVKPLTDGSSIGVHICRTDEQLDAARAELHRSHAYLLAERFVPGREVTVGIVDEQPLAPIQITPAPEAGFYDYEAKYDRDDTRYSFDVQPPPLVEEVQRHAMTVFRAIGCRHLSRVDFMVDADNRPWFLEINTMPGFTSHSLVPMAAAKAGLSMAALCDKLVRLAMKR